MWLSQACSQARSNGMSNTQSCVDHATTFWRDSDQLLRVNHDHDILDLLRTRIQRSLETECPIPLFTHCQPITLTNSILLTCCAWSRITPRNSNENFWYERQSGDGGENTVPLGVLCVKKEQVGLVTMSTSDAYPWFPEKFAGKKIGALIWDVDV